MTCKGALQTLCLDLALANSAHSVNFTLAIRVVCFVRDQSAIDQVIKSECFSATKQSAQSLLRQMAF